MNDSIMVKTPEDIRAFQLFSRKGALKLEASGLKRRGQSAFSICKLVYGFKGSKSKVLEAMEKAAEFVSSGTPLAEAIEMCGGKLSAIYN